MGRPASRATIVWYSKTACRTPWATSGWYGVYEVTNSDRPARARVTGWDLVVVGAATGEAHQPVGAGTVALGERIHVGQHVGLPAPVGQLERALQPQRFGDHVEELVEGRQSEEGQHDLDLVVGVGDVGAHDTAEFGWPGRVGVFGADVPGWTNGVSTTEAGRRRPRCSTSSRLPISVPSARRKARAMPWPSTGEKFPLVTIPTCRPWSRTMPTFPRRLATVGGQPGQAPAHAALPLGDQRLPPAEGRLVPTHHPSQARLQRGDARTELVSVQGEGGLEAQGVAGPETGRLDAGAEHRLPEALGRLGGHGTFDAVLAGVAGPGGHAAAPRQTKGVTRKRPTAAASGATVPSRWPGVGSLDGDDAAADVVSVPPTAATTRAVLEALGMTSKVSSASHQTMMSSTTEPSSRREGGCTGPGRAHLAQVVGEARLEHGEGVRPPRPAPCPGGSRRR